MDMSGRSESISDLRETLSLLRRKGVKWHKVNIPSDPWPSEALGTTADQFRVSAMAQPSKSHLVVWGGNSEGVAFEFRSWDFSNGAIHQEAVREIRAYFEIAKREWGEQIETENRTFRERAQKRAEAARKEFFE